MNSKPFPVGHMVSVYHPAPGYTLGAVLGYEDGLYQVKMSSGVISWFKEEDVQNAEPTPALLTPAIADYALRDAMDFVIRASGAGK